MSDQIYIPLPTANSIRLLSLEPGSNDGLITCKLEVFSLNEAPTYEALSYVWGNPQPAASILNRGLAQTVTPNLEKALRRLRLPDRERVIWADAICINQEDIHERECQVLLMQAIYNQASKVLVWLGDDEFGQAEKALRVINLASGWCMIETNANSLSDIDFNLVSEPTLIQRVGYGSLHASSFLGGFLGTPMWEFDMMGVEVEKWASLRWLLERPWFSRTWIIQEVAFADSIIMIGQHELEWDQLAIAAAWLDRKAYPPNRTGQDIQNMRHIRQIYACSPRRNMGIRLELAEALELLRGFDTSEIRDRVYAAVCLSNQEILNHPLLKPGYSRPIPEIFTNATEYVIRNPGSGHAQLDILSSVTGERNVLGGFPSWVPRWDEKPRTSELWFTNIGSRWNACAGKTSENISVSDRKGLVVEGIRLGTIQFVDDRLSGLSSTEENLVQQLFDERVANLRSYGPFEKVAEAFAQTITAGSSRNFDSGDGEGEPFHWEDLVSYFAWPRSKEERDRMPESHTDRMRIMQETSNFEMSIKTNHSFFVLHNGLIGMGHRSIKEGDEVWILFGGRLPYVLRSFKDHYQFRNQCYLAGCMHGSPVTAWESGLYPGDLDKKEIEIC